MENFQSFLPLYFDGFYCIEWTCSNGMDRLGWVWPQYTTRSPRREDDGGIKFTFASSLHKPPHERSLKLYIRSRNLTMRVIVVPARTKSGAATIRSLLSISVQVCGIFRDLSKVLAAFSAQANFSAVKINAWDKYTPVFVGRDLLEHAEKIFWWRFPLPRTWPFDQAYALPVVSGFPFVKAYRGRRFEVFPLSLFAFSDCQIPQIARTEISLLRFPVRRFVFNSAILSKT